MIYRRNKKGQMAILIALAFGLLFLLVAMVVNIGFLVAAKINLQNATDLAAYAGAAQQARYLSEIGKWNYEMRRNYKAMAFDYMIVLNGERKYTKGNLTPAQIANGAIDFKTYITTPTNQAAGFPRVCATLQRQGSTTDGNQSLSKTCQNASSLDFQTAILSSAEAYILSKDAEEAACANGNSLPCTLISNSAIQQFTATSMLTTTVNDTNNNLANYEKYPYNYNRRLIAWMLHDYRHLQTRIRGVHIGDISLGTYSNTDPFISSSGRWALQKDKNPTVFKNSPISVAAKVINGYTQTTGTASTSGVTPIVQGENLKNPIHNAAFGTFKKNLMKVLSNSAKLYTLVPKTGVGGNTVSNGMAGGCNGSCLEFNGPYLKLDNHDVDFSVTYTLIKQGLSDQYSYGFNLEPVTKIPVGVAKDRRVATYYTVVGTASTKDIPFNVFFGGSESSQDATMVAVAAAKPFGSRIGPFIDDNCQSDNINGKGGDSAQTACETNGLDPLYPFKSSSAVDRVPNFSIGLEDKTQRFGVKLCVDKTEYGPTVSGPLWGVSDINDDTHTVLYQKGVDKTSRVRNYTRPLGSAPTSVMAGDDGFNYRPNTPANNPNAAPNIYFDSDDNPTQPVHPFGTKNSVVAWNALTTIPNVDPAKKDNYETYLDKYHGAATYQFSTQVPDRTSPDGQDYKVYVFRYPDIDNNSWDIAGKTKILNNEGKMEKAFANAMAVSQFEINRYIIPYRNNANSGQASIDADVLNYIVTDKNNKAFIFGGVKDWDTPVGQGNIMFAGPSAPGQNNMIKEEGAEALGVNTSNDVFPETYTAWRFGSRGYRVKLVNIQDLITANNNNFQNPLEKTYTLPDSGITIDLSSIKY